MILVAGGTGTLGRELVTGLTASGHAVRVLTRTPSNATGMPAEVAVGDVRDAATLDAAVDGCACVVSAMHGFLGGRHAGPEDIDAAGNANLIRAAAAAGVGQYVLLSVLGASADHPLSLHRAKFAAEQHLYASGLGWTILRPTSYIETWAGVIGSQLKTGGTALVFGRGTNPINFVSVCDVAMLIARAIDQPTPQNQVIDVGGPDNITMVEFARQLGATKIRHIPRGALRLVATAARPFAPALAGQAGTALVMDTTDMTADSADLRRAYPDVVWKRIDEVTRDREQLQ
jgi:uncharacterized protein YbjT (DUF2867 family)